MLKTIRKITLTFVVLLLLFGAAGAIYVLVSGGASNNNINANQSAAAANIDTVPKPSKQNPNAPEGVALEALLTPAKIGSNTSMTVKTNPNSTCIISFTYNNVQSKDSGLSPKAADAYGVVTWSWTIDSGVPVGTWPVKVTCTYNKKSGVLIEKLQVTK